jgi:hypothetical protein
MSTPLYLMKPVNSNLFVGPVSANFDVGVFVFHVVHGCWCECRFPLFAIAYRRRFGLENRFIGYSQVVTTVSSYNFIITVIITHK